MDITITVTVSPALERLVERVCSTMAAMPQPMQRPVASQPRPATQGQQQQQQQQPAWPQQAAPGQQQAQRAQMPSGARNELMGRIARAGAAMAQAGKKAEVMELLSKRNVQAVSELDESEFPGLMEELRALGADI